MIRIVLITIVLHGIMSVRAAVAEDVSRPNLIYIMADDLGYGDLGCFGQKQIHTPNIDTLAAEGMKLTSYYASCTVCRPSRLSLWTGMHMGHTAIDSNQQYVFVPEDVTLAEVLNEAGYTTGGIGKWAMGGPETTGNPNQNGFDFWMGYLDQSEAHNYYPTHLWKNNVKFPLAGNVIGDYPNGRGRVASHRETYAHDVMTEQAFEFIRASQNEPFLLHMHWTIPHANNEGGRVTGNGMEVPTHGGYATREWPEPEKGHAAMIARMDGDVGRLVSLLNELDIEDNTLIIFSSDNGPHSEGGHKHEYFNSGGPLRGYKRDLYEGGIRVPTIAWWPGKIAAGTVSDTPLAAYDWFATACELAGTACPAGQDGISYVPTLLGKPQAKHEYLYWSYSGKEALRKESWKAVKLGPKKPLELYDLTNDIGETTDVAKQHPEIVSQIQDLMTQARQ